MIFSQENNSTVAAMRGGPPLTSFDLGRFPEIRAPAKKSAVDPPRQTPAGGLLRRHATQQQKLHQRFLRMQPILAPAALRA
jgi:hypothetical protein